MVKHNFAVYSSPIGYVKIGCRDNKLTLLHILDREPEDLGQANSFTDRVYREIIEYIKGERKVFDIDLDISRCSAFQSRVLRELMKIPYGETRTYKQIAIAVGNAKASRAVGMANNRNPIHIIIPCHRVIGTSGSLTGYAGGLDIKEFLLNLEGYTIN